MPSPYRARRPPVMPACTARTPARTAPATPAVVCTVLYRVDGDAMQCRLQTATVCLIVQAQLPATKQQQPGRPLPQPLPSPVCRDWLVPAGTPPPAGHSAGRVVERYGASAASRMTEYEKRTMKTKKKTKKWTGTGTTQWQRIWDVQDTPTAHTAQQNSQLGCGAPDLVVTIPIESDLPRSERRFEPVLSVEPVTSPSITPPSTASSLPSAASSWAWP